MSEIVDKWCEDEMVRGYFDGRDDLSMEPGNNQSHSYRHGFLNGRDDLRNQPRDKAEALRLAAYKAMLLDRGGSVTNH